MEKRNKIIALGIIGILIGTYFLYYTRFPNFLHGPITIESNEDFEEQGWIGNGTAANPYIISGLTIYSDIYCIKIMDTTAHFAIRNCYLETGKSATASIWFNQTINGKIESCEIVSGEVCLLFDNARNYNISNNNIHGNRADANGIAVNGGSGGLFKGNSIHDVGQVDFQSVHYIEWYSNWWKPSNIYIGWFVVEGVDHWRISDCTFVTGHVYLNDVSDIQIVNCEFEKAGLQFGHSNSDVVVSNTTIRYYSGNGLEVNGHNFEISNCSIYNCSRDGIYVDYCEDLAITNTSVIGCDGTGITCLFIDGLLIEDCIVRDNSQWGLNMSYIGNAQIQTVSSYDNAGIGLAILGGCDTVNVVDCKIYNNSDHGVVSNGVHQNTYSISISYCDIFGNAGNGVYYRQNVLGSIFNNNINDNEEWGIYIESCHNWLNLSGNLLVGNQEGDIGP